MSATHGQKKFDRGLRSTVAVVGFDLLCSLFNTMNLDVTLAVGPFVLVLTFHRFSRAESVVCSTYNGLVFF